MWRGMALHHLKLGITARRLFSRWKPDTDDTSFTLVNVFNEIFDISGAGCWYTSKRFNESLMLRLTLYEG